MPSPARSAVTILLCGVVCGAAAPVVAAQSGPPRLGRSTSAPIDVPRIVYTRFVLPNGLVVVLHEDHSSPIVALDLAYHVGSKDEPVGMRGLAHLFEHAMFDGSANVAPGEHKRIIAEAGGFSNAFTREDRTVYVEQVPSNMLETVLWLEAQRMAFLPARDSLLFELQRAAVVNEYGLAMDGSPAGATGRPLDGRLGGEVFLGAMFPDPNPYHITPFGVMSELKTATVGDYRAFFDKYYGPNNATLVLVGDFTIANARRAIERYFGGIPKRAPVTHPSAATQPLPRETRLVLEDRVSSMQQLWIGWRGAPATSQDRIALEALASVLSGGSASRLPRILINGRKLASAMPSSGHFDLENVGIFQLVTTAAPNASMTEIEGVIDSVITDVRDNGVQPVEVQRWLAAFTVASVLNLQRDVMKAALLEDGEVVYRDPGAELNNIAAARRVTPSEIQRVAREYLTRGRVVMSIVPPGKLELISKPGEPYLLVTRAKTP